MGLSDECASIGIDLQLHLIGRQTMCKRPMTDYSSLYISYEGGLVVDDIALYLAKNSIRLEPSSESTVTNSRSTDLSVITAVVLAFNEYEIEIGHLGREFIVSNKDVLEIDDAPDGTFNYFGKGCAAVISLKRAAKLIQREIIPVATLEAGRPFAYASTA